MKWSAGIWSVFDLLNFLLFLSEGKFPTIYHRMLNLPMVRRRYFAPPDLDLTWERLLSPSGYA